MAAKYGNVNFKKHGTRETRNGESAIGGPSPSSLPGPFDPVDSSDGARSKVMTQAWAKETLLLVCLCVLLLAVSITKLLCILGTIADEESIHSLTESQHHVKQLQEGKDNLTSDLQKKNSSIEQLEAEKRNLISELKQNQQHVKQLQEGKDNLTRDLQKRNRTIEMLQAEKENLSRELEKKSAHCAVGWTFYSGSCYYFSTDEKTWPASRDACISEGGHLVIITSSGEQDFLKHSKPVSTIEKYWIGLTDAVVENDWRWLDGKKLSETPKLWTGKEPDNWTGRSNEYPEGEDCAVLELGRNSYGLLDGLCYERKHKRICETKAAM